MSEDPRIARAKLKKYAARAKRWYLTALAIFVFTVVNLDIAERWMEVTGFGLAVVSLSLGYQFSSRVKTAIGDNSWNPWKPLPPPDQK